MRAATGRAGATAGPVTAALRVLTVAGLVLGSAGGLAVPAAWADTGNPTATKTNWWWSLAAPAANGQKLPVGAPAPASGVPDGDLGVGYVNDQAGTADKAAAVALDLTAIPTGSTFSSLRLSLPYDPAAHQAAAGTPDISACELLSAFPDAAGPSDEATLPPYSLPSCVKGTYSPTVGAAGGYTFDLTAMGNDWSGGAPAEGVLVVPTQGLATPQQPFSLAFLGKSGIKAEASWTLPPAQPEPAVVLPPAPAPQASAPGFAPQPPVSVPTVPAPVAPVPQPQVVASPQPQALAPVRYVPGALVPSTRWWLALLGVLALLGLTSLVLGDPLAPEPVESRRRRFAEAIRATTATAAGSHVAGAGPAHRPRPA